MEKVLDGVTLLKQYSDTNGYSYVSLCKDGKRVNRSVHRLVSQAFLPNPKSLPMVNHKDEIKTNNRVENLEWCDAKYNSSYGMGHKRNKHYYSQFSLDGEFIRDYTASQLKDNGFDKSGCRQVSLGIRNTYKGFLWKRVKFEDIWQQQVSS